MNLNKLKKLIEKYFEYKIMEINKEFIITTKNKKIEMVAIIYKFKFKRMLNYEKEFIKNISKTTPNKKISNSKKRGAISSKDRKEVNDRDSRMCCFCGSDKNPELAHIISRGNGGSGTKDNLITLCRIHHKNLDNPIGINQLKIQKEIKLFIEDWKEKNERT